MKKNENEYGYAKLEELLAKLVAKYGKGKGWHVTWEPGKRQPMKMDGMHLVAGEVDRDSRTLRVYEEDLETAERVVVHEYFEMLLDDVIDPFTVLFNQVSRAYERAFVFNQYHKKEQVIDALVNAEIEALKREEGGRKR